MARNRNEIITTFVDDAAADASLKTNTGLLPAGLSNEQKLVIFAAYENSAWFLTAPAVARMCKPKTLERARQFLAASHLTLHTFDGDDISADVTDGKRVYHPQFEFEDIESGCDCAESAAGMCSHIAALMLAWVDNRRSFLPANPSPDEQNEWMHSDFGKFFTAVTGERDYAPAMSRLFPGSMQKATDSLALSKTMDQSGALRSSGGKAVWPTACASHVTMPPLRMTIEAEFNTAQLRELARNLGIKLKGTSKSAYIDQVADELTARASRMRQSPEVLLEGLTDDQAVFVRRLMTARDDILPLPRNLAYNQWAQLANRDPDKRAADALDMLRRRAILFPTRNYVGYRDVYYQWLPLEASGGNVPLYRWTSRSLIARDKAGRSTKPVQANFIDALEKLISAVMSRGVEVRAALPRHFKTDNVPWLQHWEHYSAEAEALLNSRPGWVPNPANGISVPLHSPLTPEARTTLEGQTGLDGAQCDFLFSIAAALQLIGAPDSYNHKTPHLPKAPIKVVARGSAIEEWFALTSEAKFLSAWKAWREQVFFASEVTRAVAAGRKPHDAPRFTVMRAIGARDFGPADLAGEWAALRRYVTRVLSGLPTSEWVSWPELRRQMFEFYPDCQWSLFAPDQWWFSLNGKGSRVDINRYDEWQHTVGAVIEHIIAGPLCWFGMVDVDTGNSGLEAFRLTELQQWWMRTLAAGGADALPRLPESAQPRPRQSEPVEWLKGSGLAHAWRLPPAPDRAEFIGFARKIAGPTAVPFTYALTPDSIERAIAAGIKLDEVAMQFELMGAPMPASARALFEAVSERFGRVRVYESLAILQLTDDYALRELLGSTSLGRHVIYTISPRAVVVKAESIDALVEELVAKGYTPGVK